MPHNQLLQTQLALGIIGTAILIGMLIVLLKNANFLHLNTEKPEKAIELLSKYVPEGSKYDEDIQWYLAMAYLKVEQRGTAKLLLEGLRDKKVFYKNQAEIILSKL